MLENGRLATSGAGGRPCASAFAVRLAPVLPIVFYIGRARWTAAARVIDLVTPQMAETGRGEADGTWRADPRFVGDGYVLLDSQRVRPEDLRRDNAAALLAVSFPRKRE